MPGRIILLCAILFAAGARAGCVSASGGSSCSSCPTCCQTDNPSFNKQCQLNLVLILDNSCSIHLTQGAIASVRSAVLSFTNGVLNIANVGGQAKMGIMEFDYDAKVIYPLTDVTPAFIGKANAWVNGQNSGSPSFDGGYLQSGTCGGTNWTAPFRLARSTSWGDQVDIFVFFTDGYPQFGTQYRCGNSCFSESSFNGICSNPSCQYGNAGANLDVPSGDNSPQALWGACYEADLLKGMGTSKLLIVGVGGVSGHEDEIRLVSGKQRWDLQASTFGSADYVISPNLNDLSSVLSKVVTGLCSCLQDQPGCVDAAPGTNSCSGRLWTARARITTYDTTSSTFPKYSQLAVNMSYSFMPSPDTRVAISFFDASQKVTATNPDIVRTDIRDPCNVRRTVYCGGQCYTVAEQQAIPRFFREAVDVAGVTGARHPLVSGCSGFTKVYPQPPFGPDVPERIKYIWVVAGTESSTNIVCAAEAVDGTFYEFFSDNGSTRGVNGQGSTPPFNFSPSQSCSTPSCSRDVELVFVVDEQSSVGYSEFNDIKSHIGAIIDSFNLASVGVRFGVTWTNPASDVGGPQDPSTLVTTTSTTPNFQSTIIGQHTRNGGNADFAARVTFALNKFWPSDANDNGIARHLVTIVAGADSDLAPTDPNRYTTLRNLFQTKGVEHWAIGVGDGALNVELLANLSSTNNYVHYLTVGNSNLLGSQVGLQSTLLCPQGNLCGSDCLGLCTCVAAVPNSCQCPSCTSETCTQRDCPAASIGCVGADIVCNDNDLCTVDFCNATSGCQYTAIACNDGNPCTVDSCEKSVGCVYTPKNCDDNNVCTTDTCDANGACQHENTVVCNDDNACTVDSCDRLLGCRYQPIVCDDGNRCTEDSCNPSTGCVYTNISSSCTDSSVCTIDLCDPLLGCLHTAVTCDDGDACTVDSCSPISGCMYSPVVCDDGNACTSDSCEAGACMYDAITCDDNNTCTIDACSPQSGCTFTPRPPSFCNDNNACTTDTCDPQLGCQYTQIPSCAACSNTPCDLSPTACQTQHCAETTVQCASSDDEPTCISALSTTPFRYCWLTANPPCNDNNACTMDSCDPVNGCQFTQITCNDSNACTLDTCNAATGCRYTDNSGRCNDNNACTIDVCDPVSGCSNTAVTCDDNNACTTDTCDPVLGCVYTTVTCNDGSRCTVDSCNTTSGCLYSAISCDDGSACTSDSCDPLQGCQYTALSCDDGDACTVDTCDPGTGCVYTPIVCTNTNCTLRSCVNGACQPAGSVVCNDDNACTVDTCSEPLGGCVYTPYICAQPSTCFEYACVGGDNDGNPVCNASVPIVCDDGSSCTIDSCRQNVGCVYQNITCSPLTDCDFPIGCIGTGAQPQCLVQNISTLFDFCGKCLGDNVECFFSSVLPNSAVGGITAGVIAGIVVAAVVAALLIAFFSRKGYQYWARQSAMGVSGAHTNPAFQDNQLQGEGVW